MKTPPHYDEYRREPALMVGELEEPAPVSLWAQTWIEFTSWADVTIAPFKDTDHVLTWPHRGRTYRFQCAMVSNVALARVLFP